MGYVKFTKFMYVMLTTMLIVAFVYNKSIINYIAQQYHYEISLNNEIFNIPDSLTKMIENYRILMFENDEAMSENETFEDENIESKNEIIDLDSKDSNIKSNTAIKSPESLQNTIDLQDSKDTKDTTNLTLESKRDSKIIESSEEESNFTKSNITKSRAFKSKNLEYPNKNISIVNNKIIAKKGTNVLIIGDSLMQGISLALNKSLRKSGFKVTNLAKQSTGLAYLKGHNWIQITKNAFAKNPQIAMLIVCVGANDTWGIGAHKFGSSAWQSAYQGRVQEIYDIARQHEAVVVWYEVPAVRKPSLNAKVQVLNDIFANMAARNGGVFVESDAILDDYHFSMYIKSSSGKSLLVRADDGIHFSRNGANILTQSLMKRVVVGNEDSNIESSKDSKSVESSESLDDKDNIKDLDSKTFQDLDNENMKSNIESSEIKKETTTPCVENCKDSNIIESKNLESKKDIVESKSLDDFESEDSIKLEDSNSLLDSKKQESKDSKNLDSKDSINSHPFFQNNL